MFKRMIVGFLQGVAFLLFLFLCAFVLLVMAPAEAHARHGFNIITSTTEPQVKRGQNGGCTNGCDPVKPTGGK
jgi:hypothetical protein